MRRGVPWAGGLFVVSALGEVALLAATLSGVAIGVYPWLTVSVLLVVAILGGVFVQGAGLFARPLLSLDPQLSGARLALTFDDGPSAVTREIMTLLEENGHRGTFFMIGRQAATQLDLVKEVCARGHEIAHHGYSHSHATPFFSVDKLTGELAQFSALIKAVTGQTPQWFRPPIGILSPRVVAAAQRGQVSLVGWSASAWDGVARTSVAAATARLRDGAAPGAILVLHDGAEKNDRKPIAPQVLRQLLPWLKQRGLVSVTLSELTSGISGQAK